MWPLGDGGIQRLGRPWSPRVIRDALLYIVIEQRRGWVPHPLGQTSQCIPLLNSEEQQQEGCVEDFPCDGLSHSRQVVCQWVDGQGVG